MMRNRLRIVTIASLLAAAFFSIALLIPSHDEGPLVRGRPLYHWLEELSSRDAQTAASANEAVRELGTNALPYLLALRFAEPSRAESLLAQTLSLYFPAHQSSIDTRRSAASKGLHALGTEAAAWVARAFERNELIVRETLTPSAQKHHPVHRAAEILLLDLDTNAVPAFRSLLASSDPIVRFHAAYALWNNPARIHTATDYSLPLVRSLLPLLRDPLPQTRAMTILALNCLEAGTNLAEVVNAVGDRLDDPHSGVRSCAAVYLGNFATVSTHLSEKIAEALESERNSPHTDLPTKERYVRTRTKTELIRQLERTQRAFIRSNSALTASASR